MNSTSSALTPTQKRIIRTLASGGTAWCAHRNRTGWLCSADSSTSAPVRVSTLNAMADLGLLAIEETRGNSTDTCWVLA